MSFSLSNTAEGGTNGTTVTTANSGGSSGDAWASVTIATGGACTFSSDQPYLGALGYKFVVGSTSGKTFFNTSTASPATADRYARAYIYLSANPASKYYLFNWWGATNFCGAVGIGPDGKVYLYDSANAQQAVSAGALPLGQQVRIEAHINGNATTGSLEARIYASPGGTVPTQVVSASNINTHESPNRQSIGISGFAVISHTLYLDSYAETDAGWIGPSITEPAAGGVIVPRTAQQRPRAVTADIQGPQPSPSGTVQPRGTVPVPRRYPARAGAWRANAVRTLAGIPVTGGRVVHRRAKQYGTAARAVIRSAAGPQLISGTVQPRDTIPLPRRYPSRALTRYARGTVAVAPYIQPRASVPVPRRYPSRAGAWHAGYGANALPPPAGSVQARATIAIPRKYPQRAGMWAAVRGPGNALLPGKAAAQPPLKGVEVSRRSAARAVIRTLQPHAVVYGTVQPAATRQPRRAAARGIARTIQRYSPALFGRPQPEPVRQPRRTASRAVICTVQSPGTPQMGKVPPRSVIPVPRRYPSRPGSWQRTAGVLPLNGTVQSRDTVAVPRRYPARAVWGSAIRHDWPGMGITQPEATRLPRRGTARGIWARAINPAYRLRALGSVQPEPTRPARRTAARGTWHGLSGILPRQGAAPPLRELVARRTGARAVWGRAVSTAPSPQGNAPHGLVARREAARGTWRGLAGLRARKGQAQPRATVPLPRGGSTRGRWSWTAGLPSRMGTAQPLAVRTLPRRTVPGLQWAGIRGTLLPPRGRVQPEATRLPRRSATRAVIASRVTYARPAAGQVQPEQTAPHRRTSSRAVLHRTQAPWLLTAGLPVEFNVWQVSVASVTISFNVGPSGIPFRHVLLQQAPWISPFPSQRKLVDEPENPAQGGSA